jgi:hypothetical protein
VKLPAKWQVFGYDIFWRNAAHASEYSRNVAGDTPSDPIMDRAERHREERRAVDEAGGGESEGFELAEQDLVEHASHGDQHTPARIMRDAGPDEDQASADSVYGDADSEHLSD